MDSDLLFGSVSAQKPVALELYSLIKDLPILSPHSHIDPALFNTRFDNPVEVLIQPDHYILRMLVSQGVPYSQILSKENPRDVWQLFADYFYLFRGTPSGLWFNHTLKNILGVNEKLDSSSATSIYNQIVAKFAEPEFTPKKLFNKMRIEVLATTDPVTSALEYHRAIPSLGLNGRVIPTFRADNMINILLPSWTANIQSLETASGVEIKDFNSFIAALEQRRAYFKSLGGTATDTSCSLPETTFLSHAEVETIFQRALKGQAGKQDAALFTAHMVTEMARMSVEDGMVMQLHSGIYRNHNPEIFNQFGPDKGFDIPIRTEFTRNLKPLLDRFGNNANLTLILFTLDEALYSRELAPIAGAYPAIRIGPPWWFCDSWNGINRYFDLVMETAGLYNTVGFIDDTRSFLSIPARHDLWRRVSANWLARLLVQHLIDRRDAEEMAIELAVGLVKRTYHL